MCSLKIYKLDIIKLKTKQVQFCNFKSYSSTMYNGENTGPK